MKKSIFFILSVSLICLCAASSLAADNADYDPWEKYSLSAAWFISAIDTKVRLDSNGVGVDIDLEEITGMQSTNRSFRLDALGRFGATKKHMVNLSYFFYNRNSSRTLLIDREIGGVIIPAGDTIQSTFNIQIYKLNYSYSLLMDDRINFSAGVGLYVMPLEASLGNASANLESASVTAPLPTLNMRLEFAITPKLFLRQGVEFFYLKYGSYSGSLVDINLGLDYRIGKRFGLGLAVDSFALNLSTNGEDYPQIDFNGNIQFSYTGLMLYGKYYF